MLIPSLSQLFPFVADAKGWTAADARADMAAGLTGAFVAVPQAMAYALIAGLPPQYGIYASIAPVIIAALWGSSRFVVAGPTNATAMILFSALAQLSVGGVILSSLPVEARLPFVFGLSLLTGLIQVAMGLARLGDLVNFISHSVVVGFTTGAALLIGAGQLKTVLGVQTQSAPGFFPQLLATFNQSPQLNLWSVGVALASMLCFWALKTWTPRLPAALLTLVSVSAAGALLQVGAHGVKLAGAIPQGLPPLSLPPEFSMETLRTLFTPALALALMGAVESLAMGKRLAAARDDSFNGSQELAAQGLGNIAAAFTSGMPGCGSFTRSALNLAAGARTRFAAVFAGLIVIPLLLLLAPLAAWIPMPALAGILLMLSAGMIDREEIRFCMVTTRMDKYVFLTTTAAALLLDLERAVLLGVLLSLGLFIRRVSYPQVTRLRAGDPLLAPWLWLRDCPRLSIYLLEGTLFFGAINELERQLHEQEAKHARVVLLHMARVFWLDASGVHALASFIERCLARDMEVVLVVGNEQVMDILRRSGLLALLGDDYVARTLAQGLSLCRACCDDKACRLAPPPALPKP